MTSEQSTVSIDFFPESAFRYLDYDAIVCLDVIRATTTLVSTVATGRTVFAAADIAEAARIAHQLKDPLLAGGDERLADGHFDIANSPAALTARNDLWRPLVLVSSYGTRLLANARGCRAVFVASLRNVIATAEFLATRFRRVALLGACSRGELRCEDQIAAGRLGAELQRRGYLPASPATAGTIARWGDADAGIIRLSRSAEYLLRTGQRDDLEFILSHLDDLDLVCASTGIRVLPVGASRASEAAEVAALAGPAPRRASSENRRSARLTALRRHPAASDRIA